MYEWLLATIPSLLCGGLLWYIKRHYDSFDKRSEAREKTRVQNNILILRGVAASLQLGEATAVAIEEKKLNGEMHCARVNAKSVKEDIDTFMVEQCSKAVL